MFELQDGQSSVIQPLGGNLGWPDSYPWLYLDKDDRSGRATDGENLYIVKPEVVKRVMVFALIYEGAADFRSVGAYLTVVDHLGAITQVALDNPDANRTFCAVATITVQGDQLVIQKEERYFRGHRDADGFYGFGFDWTPGRKD
jgi:tellurite resistance protein TerA